MKSLGSADVGGPEPAASATVPVSVDQTRCILEDHKIKPIYQHIRDFVRDKIASGLLVPGDKIPTEQSLMDKFSASRMTVHRAIRGLSDEGLIERIPGSGSFVADRQFSSSVMQIADIAEEITARGHTHRCKMIELVEVASDELLAERFNITPGHPIFFSRVVHYEGSIPLQLEAKYVNPYSVPDYLDQDFNSTTTYSYIQKVAPVSRAVQSIHAVMPDADTRRHLNIGEGIPCLMIERKTWSARTVATTSQLIYPGNRYHLSSSINDL
ncbi:MAG: histidine utilization repressor [Pseudomonadota bacterium]